MIHLPIELTTEPEFALDKSDLYQLAIVDNDPITPHQQFQRTPEPWIAHLDEGIEYMFYLHGRFEGTNKIELTIGSTKNTFVPDANGILKRMGHIHP